MEYRILTEQNTEVNAIKTLILKTPIHIWTAWEGLPAVVLDSPVQCTKQLLVLSSQALLPMKPVLIIVSSHSDTQRDRKNGEEVNT